MPTYEYACRQCGEHLEAVQSFHDAPLSLCQCGGDLKKVFGNVGIVFKGSGFYRNDSRSASSAGKAPSGEAGASTSGAADSKSEAGGASAKPEKPAAAGSAAATAKAAAAS